VYDLWFERAYPDREETELHIGIHASREDAEAAVEMLKRQPGFRDDPAGFRIYEVLLGRTGWPEGFVSE
jgi:homoserine kinase type II